VDDAEIGKVDDTIVTRLCGDCHDDVVADDDEPMELTFEG